MPSLPLRYCRQFIFTYRHASFAAISPRLYADAAAFFIFHCLIEAAAFAIAAADISLTLFIY